MTISFCLAFSGFLFRFTVPQDTRLAEDLTSLRVPPDGRSPDADFRIRLLDTPLVLPGRPVGSSSALGTMNEYLTNEGRLRVYLPLTAKDGCQVACLLCHDGRHTLYYPASLWQHYADPLHCLHLIAPELLLIRHRAFLLHSSVVSVGGRSVLFAGPAEIGKSTQAELWRRHLGAEIINGDRCVVREIGGTFYGGGSPWCGTSGIRRPEMFPIAGIVLPRKSSVNRVTPLGAAAFAPLFSQTVVNSWNDGFMREITQLYSALLAQVPVLSLDCRPDEEAVRLVFRTLFGEEVPPS